MRTTADLNRIIDKIAENNPVRLESGAVRNESQDRNETERTPRSFLPRLAVAPDSLASNAPADNASESTPARRSARRGKTDKSNQTDKTVKFSNAGDEKSTSKQRDDEAKRTQRRRQIDPTTCERDYSTDEIEFMKALDDYKRASGRMFPTCSEILEVFKSLGYVKTARAESSDEPPKRNVQPNRVATPAFLSDEENDEFEFDAAPVLEIA